MAADDALLELLEHADAYAALQIRLRDTLRSGFLSLAGAKMKDASVGVLCHPDSFAKEFNAAFRVGGGEPKEKAATDEKGSARGGDFLRLALSKMQRPPPDLVHAQREFIGVAKVAVALDAEAQAIAALVATTEPLTPMAERDAAGDEGSSISS